MGLFPSSLPANRLRNWSRVVWNAQLLCSPAPPLPPPTRVMSPGEGREGMEGRGEAGQGLMMGEGQGMSMGLGTTAEEGGCWGMSSTLLSTRPSTAPCRKSCHTHTHAHTHTRTHAHTHTRTHTNTQVTYTCTRTHTGEYCRILTYTAKHWRITTKHCQCSAHIRKASLSPQHWCTCTYVAATTISNYMYKYEIIFHFWLDVGNI